MPCLGHQDTSETARLPSITSQAAGKLQRQPDITCRVGPPCRGSELEQDQGDGKTCKQSARLAGHNPAPAKLATPKSKSKGKKKKTQDKQQEQPEAESEQDKSEQQEQPEQQQRSTLNVQQLLGQVPVLGRALGLQEQPEVSSAFGARLTPPPSYARRQTGEQSELRREVAQPE